MSPPAALRRLLSEIGTVDYVGIEERVAKYGTRSIKKGAKLFGLKLATSMIEEGLADPGDHVGRQRTTLGYHRGEAFRRQVLHDQARPAFVLDHVVSAVMSAAHTTSFVASARATGGRKP